MTLSIKIFSNTQRRIIFFCKSIPNVKVSIAHLGGFQYQELVGTDIYVNISSILPDLVNKYGIKKSNDILLSFGVEKLVFASDYPDDRKLKPNEIYDKYFEILNKMDFSKEEIEKISMTNAINMIGK